jgi:hypothetical protein
VGRRWLTWFGTICPNDRLIALVGQEARRAESRVDLPAGQFVPLGLMRDSTDVREMSTPLTYEPTAHPLLPLNVADS